MLDMCLVTRVFLQANSCPISKMKRVRHKCVKRVYQRRKEEENIVCNSHFLEVVDVSIFLHPARVFLTSQ
jgi:hypothetical protein